jgi:hypothetical protein
LKTELSAEVAKEDKLGIDHDQGCKFAFVFKCECEANATASQNANANAKRKRRLCEF